MARATFNGSCDFMPWQILVVKQGFCMLDTGTLVRRMKLPSSDDSEQLLSNYKSKFGETKLIVLANLQEYAIAILGSITNLGRLDSYFTHRII